MKLLRELLLTEAKRSKRPKVTPSNAMTNKPSNNFVAKHMAAATSNAGAHKDTGKKASRRIQKSRWKKEIKQEY